MATFVGDVIKLLLNTGETLTGYDVYIKYCKPDGTTGKWRADICGTNAKVVEYDTVIHTDLDQSGVWKLQAFSFSGITVRTHGKKVDLVVEDPLRYYLTTLAPTTLAPTTPAP